MKIFSKKLVTLALGSSIMMGTLAGCGDLGDILGTLTKKDDKSSTSSSSGSSSSNSGSSNSSSSNSSSSNSSSSNSGSSNSSSSSSSSSSGFPSGVNTSFSGGEILVDIRGNRGFLSVKSSDGTYRVINGSSGSDMSFVTEPLGGSSVVPVYNVSISPDEITLSFTHREVVGQCKDYSGAFNPAEGYYAVFESQSSYPCSF